MVGERLFVTSRWSELMFGVRLFVMSLAKINCRSDYIYGGRGLRTSDSRGL